MITGLQRLAATVAMDSTARPLKIMRRPRHWLESRLNGQMLARAPICRRLRVPHSGRVARKVTEVAELVGIRIVGSLNDAVF